MEIVFQPSWLAIVLVIVVPCVAALSIWLKKGKRAVKIVSTIALAVIVGFVAFLFIRPTRIVVDQQGLYTDVYFEHRFQWGQVKEAGLIPDLGASEFEPAFRQNGMAIGFDRKGYFSLKNGQNAFVMTQTDDRALYFSVEDKIYLFAPKDFDRFYDAVSKYITIKE
ncbi:MAG: hypothetical protein JXR70_04905 [Spirochaetales bacterium]|nr:hypothetical protein [Spirochaetales bacterium]